MSSCLSGGGRAYGFDLEIIKSPSSSTITSQTSSPSLSESSNFSNTISTTRKPRTPRKRPNQTYNEAAALLSTACPNIFSPKIVTKPFKFSKSHDYFVNYSSSADLLLPFRVFDNSGFLIHQPIPDKPNSRAELKALDFCENLKTSSGFSGSYLEDFDAESILDEEIIEEGGIDSIMGNLSVENGDDSTDFSTKFYDQVGTCYGYPMGLGFGGEFGFNRAFRHVDEGEWWRFPQVDIGKFSPKLNNKMVEKKKKKVEKALEIKSLVQETQEDVGSTISKQEKEKGKENEEILVPIPKPRLLLSLNFDEVANAWSDRGSPFPDEISSQDSAGGDLQARLASIDLFSENGGVREARVLRYKEKRRTRLFSKKIRYQVRKVNADQRPRMKGRFVRRPDSP